MSTPTISKPTTGQPGPALWVAEPVGNTATVPDPEIPGASGPSPAPASPPVPVARSLRIDRIRLRAPSGPR